MNALRSALLVSFVVSVPAVAPTAGAGQIVQAAAHTRAAVDRDAKDTVPKVVGGLGWDLSLASRGRGVSRFVLLSNIAGAAAGGAANGLGIDWLRDYFIDNTALGVGFPSGGHKLTGVLQIGLGEVTILKNAPLWPVLSLEQLDSADARVPAELRGESAASWTYPSVAVGFPIKMRAPKTPPAIGTISLGLPYFFPGSPFPAVGALFSEDHKKYRRAGRIRVALGVQILFRKASRE